MATSATTRTSLPGFLEYPDYLIYFKFTISIHSQARPNKTEKYLRPIRVILEYSLPPGKHHADNEIGTRLVTTSVENNREIRGQSPTDKLFNFRNVKVNRTIAYGN